MTVEEVMPLLEYCNIEAAKNEEFSPSPGNDMNHKQDIPQIQSCKDKIPGGEFWNDGLICAFEFVYVPRRSRLSETIQTKDTGNSTLNNKSEPHNVHNGDRERVPIRSHWRPIGWARISELIQTVEVEREWNSMESHGLSDEESEVTVADIASPCWERPVGPTWWCHVDAGHPFISAWLSSAQWLHPAISIALREENKLISERMKYLLYEVCMT